MTITKKAWRAGRNKAKRWKRRKKRKWTYLEYMHSAAWERKRNAAFNHHGRFCHKCGSTHRLNAHHRTYARLGHERMSDIVILCRSCHSKEHPDKPQYFRDVQDGR